MKILKIKCSAPDCGTELMPKVPHSKYCSDQCRSRTHKRKTYKERAKKGLCVQCGGEMDMPKKTPSYCTKCQTYFRKRYQDK